MTNSDASHGLLVDAGEVGVAVAGKDALEVVPAGGIPEHVLTKQLVDAPAVVVLTWRAPHLTVTTVSSGELLLPAHGPGARQQGLADPTAALNASRACRVKAGTVTMSPVTTAVLIACMATFLPAFWTAVWLHERGHARVAEWLTPDHAPVAARVGAPVLWCPGKAVARRLGFQRSQLLLGPVPGSGYCAHEPLTTEADLRTLYAAGTDATGVAARRTAAVGIALAALMFLPLPAREIVVVLPSMVLTFAAAFGLDYLGNRWLRLGPWFPGVNEGSDGYVLSRLGRGDYRPHTAMTAPQLLSRFRHRYGCGQV